MLIPEEGNWVEWQIKISNKIYKYHGRVEFLDKMAGFCTITARIENMNPHEPAMVDTETIELSSIVAIFKRDQAEHQRKIEEWERELEQTESFRLLNEMMESRERHWEW